MKMNGCSGVLLPRPLMALLLGVVSVAMGQSDAPVKVSAGSTNEYEFRVSSETVWTDTSLELHRGDKVLLNASGTVEFPLGQIAGPGGMKSDRFEARPPGLPLSDGPRGAFLARIGEADTGLRLLVGAHRQIDVVNPGRLYLGVNEHEPGEAVGSFKVQVEIKRRAANLASRSDEAVAALLPPNVLATIPRRARNSHGQPEDLVNVLIFGTEEDLKLTFQAAGWVVLNRTDGSPAVSRDALQNISEEAYMARPLPELYLFSRAQDYGFAHTEMAIVVHARHYLRVWRNPSDVNGQVGAAAHDTGPWWNRRVGDVSYKIDPDVDREREFVSDTLNATGLVNRLGCVRFFARGKRLRTTAGSMLRTDGRVLVMTLLHLPEP